KAILIILHHLAESLKDQYSDHRKDPLDLWKELKSRYDHQKTILLPKALYDWKHLRIQDFKSVDEYNSALYKLVSIMRLCGEKVTEKDLLEKTFSTFHSTNILLQQQYRQKGFKTYYDLISCLLLAEANNELLMRNNDLRPPGSAPLPEAHTATEARKESNHVQTSNQHGRSRGKWNGRGRGRGSSNPGRGTSFGRGHGRGRGTSFK